MSKFLDRVRALVHAGEVRISEHGYDELADDGLSAREVLAGVADAVVVEEYPNYPKGPCILLLQRDSLGTPIHAVWGILEGIVVPLYWLRRTGLLQSSGIAISCKGGEHYDAT